MKDYQKDAIETITSIFKQINQISYPKNDMISRLERVIIVKKAADLKTKASKEAAYAEAYSYGKSFIDNIVNPVMSHFFKPGDFYFEVYAKGSVYIKYNPLHKSLTIASDISEHISPEDGSRSYKLCGFQIRPTVGQTVSKPNISDFTIDFESWVKEILENTHYK